MSYRNITVGDQTHRYSVGRTFVKFHGGPLVPVSEIGHPIRGSKRFLVTPGRIREYLVNGRVNNDPRPCNSSTRRNRPCPNWVSDMRALPFDYEIHGKLHYVYLCEDCCDENAQEI